MCESPTGRWLDRDKRVLASGNFACLVDDWSVSFFVLDVCAVLMNTKSVGWLAYNYEPRGTCHLRQMIDSHFHDLALSGKIYS